MDAALDAGAIADVGDSRHAGLETWARLMKSSQAALPKVRYTAASAAAADELQCALREFCALSRHDARVLIVGAGRAWPLRCVSMFWHPVHGSRSRADRAARPARVDLSSADARHAR